MQSFHIRKAVAVLLLFSMLLSGLPLSAFAEEAFAEEPDQVEPVPTETTTATVEPTTVEETSPPDSTEATELPAEAQSTADPAETPERSAPEATVQSSSADAAADWRAAGLYKFAEGSFVPYNPITGEVEHGEGVKGSGGAIAKDVYYKDIFGAHAEDLNGYYVKAGGQFDSWVYGSGQWWPATTGVLSPYTGKRVITGSMWSNDGPTCRFSDSAISIPIRPSQESGWSMDIDGYGDYVTTGTGVPKFKSESLYTKLIPAYSQSTWREINLIYAVAKGMGGMTETGDVNVTCAATTLIANEVFGYIGIGSDGKFHGLPLATTSSAVNTQMARILAWCNVYSVEKGLNGSFSGDNTVSAFQNKGFSVPNTSGYYVKSGSASAADMYYKQIDKSQSSGNQVYIWAWNSITFDNGKSVSIKKTANASASVLACIQDNPLYTLKGAVYEIHQGSATGPVVETLTTNANGEASGSKKYAIGTVLYAVETQAPSGYLLDSTPAKLTVAAGDNVFSVKDKPTFDPRAMSVKKTNTDGEVIPGAIFKASFYAQNWETNAPQRVWYLMSDENGRIRFDDAHLITDDPKYPSDPLFKPDGAIQFPLGCVKVEEIKAAKGYVLPKGADATTYIFIRQGGTQTAQPGKAAGAYWGTPGAKPITTQNPKGIYHMENDANLDTITAENDKKSYLYMRKSLTPGTAGDLEGYAFNFFRAEDNTLWYGRTDADGRIYKTKSNHNFVAEDDRVYTFKNIANDTGEGTYAFREILNGKPAITESIKFIVTNGDGEVTMEKLYSREQLNWDANGDCTISNVYLKGLNDGARLNIEITNMPLHGTPFEIKKIDPSKNPVEGAIFKVEYESDYAENKRWHFKSDSDGYVTLDEAHLITNHAVYQSDELFSADQIPVGKMTVTEVKAPDGYFKNDFVGYWVMKQAEDDPYTIESYWATPDGKPTTSYGDDVYLLDEEPGGLYVENVPEVKLDIVKTSSNGRIKDVEFRIEKQVGTTWQNLAADDSNYLTDANGKIHLENLDVGMKLRITEIVPEGAICLSENPQIITLEPGMNTVHFENLDISLEIIKTATDGKIKGIQFEVSKRNTENKWELLGTYTTDAEGKIAVETQHLAVGAQFRIKEIVPNGTFCVGTNPKTITLEAGRNSITFQNKPLKLTIAKTSTDGKVDGIDFVVDIQNGENWDNIGTYTTGTDGKINIEPEKLKQGATYRITEIVPENYICTSENPQIVTLNQATTTVNISNKPFVDLEIIKTSSDGKVEGIQFKIEKSVKDGPITTWEPLDPDVEHFTTDEIGKITIGDELVSEGMNLRITEIVPQGYICESKNPQTITIVKGKNTVSFENRPIFGNLEITKVDEAFPDHKLSGAEFTVTMTKPDSSVETAIMTEVLDEDGNGTGVYRLEGIEYNTVCEIRETAAPEGYELSDEVFTVTIQEEKTYVIATPDFEAVINRQKEGKISVHKEDAEHNAMSGVQFLLEYSVDNGTTWAPIQARTADDPVAPGYCTSEGLTDGILTTGADGNIVFTGLALSAEINSNVQYRITEVKTQDGKTLLGVSVYNGPLTLEDPELAYKVVNESVFEMPHTGGNGFAAAGIGMGLCVLAALFILFTLPKKGKKIFEN